MSDILIIGSAGFTGSNISNYLIQHTNLLISGLDDLELSKNLNRLQPSVQSKSRYTFYLSNPTDEKISKKILEVEKPKTIIYNLIDSQLDLGSKSVIETLIMWNRLSSELGVEKFIITVNSSFMNEDLSNYRIKILRTVDDLVNNNDKLRTISLLSSYLYGPRMGESNPVSKIINSYIYSKEKRCSSNDNSEKSFIYIKDYFYSLLSLIHDNDKTGSFKVLGNEKYSLKIIDDCISSLVLGRQYVCNTQPEKSEESSVIKNFEEIEVVAKFDFFQTIEHTLFWVLSNKWINE